MLKQLKQLRIVKPDCTINANWRKLVTPEIELQLGAAFKQYDVQTLSQLVWHLQNGPEKPRCACGKVPSFARSSYRQSCSVRCSARSASTQVTRQATNVERHGTPFPQQLATTKQRAKATVLSRYGAQPAHLFGGDTSRRLMLDRYGVENAGQHPELRAKRNRTISAAFNARMEALLETHGLTALRPISSSRQTPLRHTCGFEFSRRIWACQVPRCPACFPHQLSTQHLAIRALLIELGVKFTENDRTIIKPQELDFYLPDRSLAIEVNGLYWHSEAAGTYKGYHQQKTLRCLGRGVTLIHLYEDQIDMRINEIRARLVENYLQLEPDDDIELDGLLKVDGSWPLPQQFSVDLVDATEPHHYNIDPGFRQQVTTPVWDSGSLIYRSSR
jgi:hypothetical protein